MNSSWKWVPDRSWEVNLAGVEAPAERRTTDTKKNLRGKIREFVQSEEGKVGVKSPLALGLATGSIFLAQAIMVPTPAMACVRHDDCPGAAECVTIEVCVDNNAGRTCWDENVCI